MRKRTAVILFVLVVLFIFLITIDVFSNLRDWIYQNHVNDKIAHFFFAAILTFLANFIFYPKKMQAFRQKIWLGSVVMFIFYSVDEVSQVFIPGRDSDPFDLLASLMGLLIGDILFRWRERNRH